MTDLHTFLTDQLGQPPTDWQMQVAEKILHVTRHGAGFGLHLGRRAERAQAKRVLDALDRLPDGPTGSEATFVVTDETSYFEEPTR